jgi:hypothetical protein
MAKLSGNAELDLPNQRMHGSLSVDLNAGDEALTGADPGLRLDFNGPLASPNRALDVTDITGFLSLRAFERERRHIERLQSNVLEKQRLRREVALYRFDAAQREIQRQHDAQIEQQRRAEEERLRALAQQAAAEKKAEADARAKAEADERARAEAQRQMPGGPTAPDSGTLNFNGLPGIAR